MVYLEGGISKVAPLPAILERQGRNCHAMSEKGTDFRAVELGLGLCVEQHRVVAISCIVSLAVIKHTDAD